MSACRLNSTAIACGARGKGMSTTGLWRYENRLIAVLSLMFGFVFFDRNAMSYLATFAQEDLQLNNTEIGMLASALSFTWAISGLLVGLLADRTGKRKPLLIAAVIVFSLCSVLSGLAGSFVLLLAARMLMGFAEGGIAPISQSLVALESDERRRGLNMGVMQNLGSNFIGSFLAPIVLVWLATVYGWREAFYIAAIPGLICAFLIWKYVREPQTHEISPKRTQHERMSVMDMFRYRNMSLCILISIVMVAWMVLGWAFLQVIYVNHLGIPREQTGWLMGLLGISASVFAFIVPGLSDRLGRKPVMTAFCLIGMLYPFAVIGYTGSIPLMAVLIFIGWSASGTFPLFMATIPSETIPARYLVTSLGLVMGLGEFVGGTAAPTLAGRAADLYGQTAPMWIAAGCAALATVLTLFLKETAPVKLKAAAAASAPTG